MVPNARQLLGDGRAVPQLVVKRLIYLLWFFWISVTCLSCWVHIFFHMKTLEFQWSLVLIPHSILAPWDFEDKYWFGLAEQEGSWVARYSLREGRQ